MSSKRVRKPVNRDDYQDGDEIDSYSGKGSLTSTAAKQQQRAGRANKKRDDRSALVEIWMVKNESGDKPSSELKDRYAENLKIHKDHFWDIMKMYALKSKLSCVPDFEQIWHHMKDKAELLQDLKVQGVDYWWELDEQGVYYKPNTQNLKNFKPASGLLHHFYHTYIHNEERFNEVRHNPRARQRYRHDPSDLDDLVAKLSPFRRLPEPKALLVLPSMASPNHYANLLRGTYALSKKINGFNVFIRPPRMMTGKGSAVQSVVINGTTIDIPIHKTGNYSPVENGLTLFSKEDKKEAGADEAEGFQNVPLRLRIPSNGQLLETIVEDLGHPVFQFSHALGVEIYPIRGLLPLPQIMGFLDFGAVWNGCFSPFPRTAASVQEFAAAFESFPQECLEFFFLGNTGEILAEDYIRFMTWFANYDEGLGQECAFALALKRALEGMPFYLHSKSEELRLRQLPGSFAVRLSDTKAQCLTVEVLKDSEDEARDLSVLCFRVRVDFVASTYTAPEPSSNSNAGIKRGKSGGRGKAAAAAGDTTAVSSNTHKISLEVQLPSVKLSLEDADGQVLVCADRLDGPVMKKIEQLAGLSTDLMPLQEDEYSRNGRLPNIHYQAPSSMTVPPADTISASRSSVKRKRGAVVKNKDALPPPMSKMGTAGASSFNDQTFDINGNKQMAAAQVRRQRSNVVGGAAGNNNQVSPPLQVWGQHIPMPHFDRDHSLTVPYVAGRESSTGVGKGDSWGSVMRNIDLSPAGGIGRDHSLGFGLSGISREMSLGSLDFPLTRSLSRGLSQGSTNSLTAGNNRSSSPAADLS